VEVGGADWVANEAVGITVADRVVKTVVDWMGIGDGGTVVERVENVRETVWEQLFEMSAE
jgi:hypothetical protein